MDSDKRLKFWANGVGVVLWFLLLSTTIYIWHHHSGFHNIYFRGGGAIFSYLIGFYTSKVIYRKFKKN